MKVTFWFLLTSSVLLGQEITVDWSRVKDPWIGGIVTIDVRLNNSGTPILISTADRVPEPVVDAVSHSKANPPIHRTEGRFPVAIRISATEGGEVLMCPVLHSYITVTGADRLSARKLGRLETHVGDVTGGSLDERAELLTYYSTSRKVNAGIAKLKRRELLLWFIQTQPDADLLSYDVALVNKEGDDLADAEGFAQLSAAWNAAVLKYPENPDVLAHAVFFHAIPDPETALRIIQSAKTWLDRERWLGYVLRMMAEGAQWKNIREHQLNFDARAISQSSRERLLTATGLGAVLSAMWSLSLKENPTSFCTQLLTHTRSLFAQTEASCAAGSAAGTPKTEYPKLITKVEPEFPESARHFGDSDIELVAVVDRTGRLTNIGLEKGNPAFWPPALRAIERWTFKPATLNGVAVPVSASILINFRLR